MAFDRQAAKQAGYTDEEIDAYLKANPQISDTKPADTEFVNSLPPPTTVVPEVERGAETGALVGLGAGGAVSSVAGLAKDLAGPAATAYGAYKLGQAIEKRGAARAAAAVPPSSPIQEATGPVRPSGQPVRTVNIVGEAPVAAPSAGPVQPAAQPATTATRPLSREAQQYLAQQAERTAAPAAAEAGGSMLSRMAPYLRAAGRIAGPAGMAAGAYEAAQMAQEQQLGQRLAQGQGRMAQQAYRNLINQNVSGYTPSAQEARNLLASGDERTINIYGGRARLQAIANPNAINSGYAQELKRLGQ